jgi:hypothetical protein
LNSVGTDTLVVDLKRQIERGNIVVVAGTGVSVATCEDSKIDGFAVSRWEELLIHGVNHCMHVEGVLDADEAELLQRQIRTSKVKFLVAAAGLIEQSLESKRPGAYRGWLKQTVGQLRATKVDLPQALGSLGGVLATLSYDDLIEQATGRTPLTWLERDRVEDVLRGGAGDKVLHLHGHFDDPDSVILGLESYLRVATDPHAQTVLRTFALQRTLLFVGCRGTVRDPNFERLAEWAGIALENSAHRHYLLCLEGELDAVRAELKQAPWLYAIPYGKGHGNLVPFLRSLLPEASHERGVAIPNRVQGRAASPQLNCSSVTPIELRGLCQSDPRPVRQGETRVPGCHG